MLPASPSVHASSRGVSRLGRDRVGTHDGRCAAPREALCARVNRPRRVGVSLRDRRYVIFWTHSQCTSRGTLLACSVSSGTFVLPSVAASPHQFVVGGGGGAVRMSDLTGIGVNKPFDPFADAETDSGVVTKNLVHIRLQMRSGRKSLTTIQGVLLQRIDRGGQGARAGDSAAGGSARERAAVFDRGGAGRQGQHQGAWYVKDGEDEIEYEECGGQAAGRRGHRRLEGALGGVSGRAAIGFLHGRSGVGRPAHVSARVADLP
eukprot:ctg_672.g373